MDFNKKTQRKIFPAHIYDPAKYFVRPGSSFMDRSEGKTTRSRFPPLPTMPNQVGSSAMKFTLPTPDQKQTSSVAAKDLKVRRFQLNEKTSEKIMPLEVWNPSSVFGASSVYSSAPAAGITKSRFPLVEKSAEKDKLTSKKRMPVGIWNPSSVFEGSSAPAAGSTKSRFPPLPHKGKFTSRKTTPFINICNLSLDFERSSP